jgi:hypothetical protein
VATPTRGILREASYGRLTPLTWAAYGPALPSWLGVLCPKRAGTRRIQGVATDVARTSPSTSAARFLLVAIVAALTYELMAAPAGRTATPCWQELITDWSDGRIDGTYPVACYRKALKAMPEDIRLYSSASDDISRALAGRVHATRRTAAAAPSVAGSALGAPVDGPRRDSFGVPLLLGASLAIIVAILVGGAIVARRKLPPNRTR